MSDLPQQKATTSLLKWSHLYLCFKITTTVLLTLLLMIAIIVTLGNDEHVYHQKLIYQVYEGSPQIKTTFTELQDKIKRNNLFDAINLHLHSSVLEETSQKKSKQGSVDWQNLAQVSNFYGYLFSSQGNSTIRHTMRHPSENISNIRKADNRRISNLAYQFKRKTSLISYLRTKILKMLSNIIHRLKLKQLLSENQLLQNPVISFCWHTFIEENTPGKIWIVNLDPQNTRHHNAPTLFRKIQEWKRSHQNDRLIIVSKQPIAAKNKKILNLQINLHPESLFQHLDKGITQRLNISFLSNYPSRVLAQLLNYYQGSLAKLSHFIEFYSENQVLNQVNKFVDSKFLNKKAKGQELCKQKDNYIEKMNDNSYKKSFKNVLESSKNTKTTSLKKEIALYFNIIRLEVCNQAVQRAEAKPNKKEKDEPKTKEKPAKQKLTNKKPKQQKKKGKTEDLTLKQITKDEIQTLYQASLHCNTKENLNQCQNSAQKQQQSQQNTHTIDNAQLQNQTKTIIVNKQLSKIQDQPTQILNTADANSDVNQDNPAEKEQITQQLLAQQRLSVEDKSHQQQTQKQEPIKTDEPQAENQVVNGQTDETGETGTAIEQSQHEEENNKAEEQVAALDQIQVGNQQTQNKQPSNHQDQQIQKEVLVQDEAMDQEESILNKINQQQIELHAELDLVNTQVKDELPEQINAAQEQVVPNHEQLVPTHQQL